MTTRPSDYSSVNIVSREFKADPFPFYGACARSSQSAELNSRTRMPGWSPVTTMYSHFLKTAGLPKIEPRPLTPEQPGKQPWMPDFAKPLLRNMLDLDEPDHTRLRTLVHKAFTPSMVERLQDRIQNIADELLDAMQSRSSMDLVHDYALPIPLTVIVELLGIPSQDRHRFHRWSKAIVRTPTTFNMVRALPPIRAFMRYLRQLVRQLRTAPQEGLLTALAQVEEAGDRLSEDELLAMAFLLLIAGHETTVNLIASGMLALLQHPDQMELLRNDPTLIKPAVEELLRFTNPLETATERYAREDVTIAGVTIPRGALVFAVIASANRDSLQFEDPDRLNITREKNRHLAFGQGAHFCLGAPLARLEGQIAIPTVLRRLPNLKLAVPLESLRWRAAPFLRGLEGLPVRF